MDMPAALRARAIGDAGVAALASTRVHWVQRPQAGALPAVTLTTISDPRPQHLKGFDSLRETRVQADCWATSHKQANDLAEEMIAALVPEHTGNGITFNRALVDAVRDLGEQTETIFIHRTSIDFRFWWRTS